MCNCQVWLKCACKCSEHWPLRQYCLLKGKHIITILFAYFYTRWSAVEQNKMQRWVSMNINTRMKSKCKHQWTCHRKQLDMTGLRFTVHKTTGLFRKHFASGAVKPIPDLRGVFSMGVTAGAGTAATFVMLHNTTHQRRVPWEPHHSVNKWRLERQRKNGRFF